MSCHCATWWQLVLSRHILINNLSESSYLMIHTITICSDSTSQMDLYDQRASQTRRYPPSVSSSPQKDMQPKVRTKLPSFSLKLIKHLIWRCVSTVLRGVSSVDNMLKPHAVLWSSVQSSYTHGMANHDTL